MVQDVADHPRQNHTETGTAFGPTDAVLFDTLDARLTDLDLHVAPDGTLFATTSDSSSTVRLAVTDRGLAATEIIGEESTEDDLTSVTQIDPAPESDVDAGTDIRTRLRGD